LDDIGGIREVTAMPMLLVVLGLSLAVGVIRVMMRGVASCLALLAHPLRLVVFLSNAVFTSFAMLSGLLNSDIAINANIAIMRAFVAMRNYITTTDNITAELREMRAKLALLERNDEENMEAVNDLSEDMRRELDNIYNAIAELSVKPVQANRKPSPIGFKNGR